MKRTLSPVLSRLLPLLGACVCLFPVSLSAQTSPGSATTNEVALSYVIMSTDRLRIEVYQEDDLSTVARVDATGAVNLKLVGQVNVKGNTVREAQSIIEGAYREGRYLRSPQVTINVEEYATREVTVTGMVRGPGRFPLPIESSMTLLDLITKAGGLTDTAKGTSVRVTRIQKDGSVKVFTLDVESLIKGKDKASTKDPGLILQPGDVVYVPERLI